MIADCPGCAPAPADIREPSRVRARLPWLGVVPAILYALAPKRPMCLAAYLSAFGVTVGMTSLALSVLGPLAAASVVLGLGALLIRRRRNYVAVSDVARLALVADGQNEHPVSGLVVAIENKIAASAA
jgi:hypothetical protein